MKAYCAHFTQFQSHWTKLFALAMDGNYRKHHPHSKTHQPPTPFAFSLDHWRESLYSQYLYPHYGIICDQHKTVILDTMNATAHNTLKLDQSFYNIDQSIHISDYHVKTGRLTPKGEEDVLALLEVTCLMNFKNIPLAQCLDPANQIQSPYLIDYLNRNPLTYVRFSAVLDVLEFCLGHFLDHFDEESLAFQSLSFDASKIESLDLFLRKACDVDGIEFGVEPEDTDGWLDDIDDDDDDIYESIFYEMPDVGNILTDDRFKHDIQRPFDAEICPIAAENIESWSNPNDNHQEKIDHLLKKLPTDFRKRKRVKSEDILGHYLHHGHIRLYGFKISQSLAYTNQKYHLSLHDDVQTLEVYTHELGHLMAHQCRTKKLRSWHWMSKSIHPIVEGMAQYFTWRTAKQLAKNKMIFKNVFKLHQCTAPTLSKAYRVHFFWINNFNNRQVMKGFAKYIDQYEFNLPFVENKVCGANLHFYHFQAIYLNDGSKMPRYLYQNIYCPAGEVPKRYHQILTAHYSHLYAQTSKIDKAFWIFNAPVNQQLWFNLMGYQPSFFYDGINTEMRPVDHVSKIEAMIFCNQLSGREGLTPYYEIKYKPNFDLNAFKKANQQKHLILQEIQKEMHHLIQNQGLNFFELWRHLWAKRKDLIQKFNDCFQMVDQCIQSIKINTKSKGYRLPHFNQWLYAACADGRFMTTEINHPNDLLHPRKFQTYLSYQKQPNLWDIHEMSTNVAELLDDDRFLTTGNAFNHCPLIYSNDIDFYEYSSAYERLSSFYFQGLTGLRPIKPAKSPISINHPFPHQ